jgi:tetratricopeptide (TPR) repeat protein
VGPIAAQTVPQSGPPSQQAPGFDQLSTDANAARQSGDLTRASELYAQALRINPSWPDGWWYLGQLRYSADDYQKATDAFTHYLNLVPDAAPATALRGLCEFELGQYEPSLHDVQHALSLGAADDSRNTQILRYHEGLLLTKLGRFEEALTAYGFFTRQHISNDELLSAVGLATLRIPQFPKDDDPAQRDMIALAGNATFLLLSGDKPAADQAFQTFFQRYPTAANVHYTLGYLVYPTDQDAAIAEFQRELTVDPGNAVDHTMLAWALLMNNSPAEALPEAKKAAEEAPTLPLAQLSLGRALLETGDTKSAISLLENALALDPQSLEIHIALARAYSASGREDDARRERLACLQLTQQYSKPAPAMGQQGVPAAQ